MNRPAAPGGRSIARTFLLLLLAPGCVGSSSFEAASEGTVTGASQAPSVDGAALASVPFDIIASGRELNLGSGETVILQTRSAVPGRQTIEIRNMAGAVVRTLVNEPRPPGRFEDAWDGYGDGSARLPNGQYRWVSVLDTGTACLRIDHSSEVDGDFEVKAHPEYRPWSPFENVPLHVEHAFERPGEILLVFSPVTFPVYASCDPPQFCRWLDGYQPSGPFLYEWAGVDDAGAYRPDVHGILVISSHEQISRNAIIVHGGGPGLARLTALPSYYRPGAGLQKIEFTLRAHALQRSPEVIHVCS
ncbi:MAG: hypothetical protein IT186_21830 [Acidobacteria bacterium]|nr:hypothetical protein [Acidobacteriota bacterium]